LVNFHTHSNFCDGKEEPRLYVESAIEKGFIALGFSSHAPTPFELDWTLNNEKLPFYFEEIKKLKEEYRGKIEIYLGLEFDFFKKAQYQSIYFNYKEMLDYNLASVHFLSDRKNEKFYIIDGSIDSYINALNEVFKGDVKSFVKEYYNLIKEMILTYKPDIIAHIDLIKKNNKDAVFFKETEEWYREAILETLDIVSKSSSILEVNTGGIARGSISDFYPSEWLFKECYRRNIPVIINSDAHDPGKIDALFTEAKKSLKRAGFSTQKILLKGKWIELEI
jgi:histidinol-phosphatase (PHP family)